MKEYTPAKANKVLGFLADERRRLLDFESSEYVCCSCDDEKPEPDDPSYSYERTRERVRELDRKTASLRHALHRFSSETVLPEAGVTVDEAHIRLGLMGKEKRRLASLRDVPRRRSVGTGMFLQGPKYEYECANFDVGKAERDYLTLCEDIAELQLEVSLVEQTKTFAADI